MGQATLVKQYVEALRHQADARFPRTARTALQIARARLLHGIGPRFFCAFRLADKPVAQWADYVIEFSDFKRRLAALSPPTVHAIADDKVKFHLFCRDHGLATIPIEFLVLRRSAADYPGVPTVTDIEEWRAALARSPGRLFFKPVDGVWGEGAFGLTPVPGGCEFDGRVGSIDEAFEFVASRLEGTGGYVVQPRIDNHPAVRALTSAGGLSTVRMVTCQRDDAVRLLYAVMKVTVGSNVTDNFHHGSSGNLVAPVDVPTGRVGVAVGALRRDWPVMADFAHHPETGQAIEGFCIPNWPAAVRLVNAAHRALPELRITGWDVAITESGPLIVETNPRFAFDILQIAHGRGLKREVMQAVGMT